MFKPLQFRIASTRERLEKEPCKAYQMARDKFHVMLQVNHYSLKQGDGKVFDDDEIDEQRDLMLRLYPQSEIK